MMFYVNKVEFGLKFTSAAWIYDNNFNKAIVEVYENYRRFGELYVSDL